MLSLNQDPRELFRFNADDILYLTSALKIPDPFRTAIGSRFSAHEALCVLLRKWAFPARWPDLTTMFRRTSDALAGCKSELQKFLYYQWVVPKLDKLDTKRIIPRLPLYSVAIYERGAPLNNVWGFIDGTLRPTTRPSVGQEAIYNGKDCVHGLKYQGMLLNLPLDSQTFS